MKPKRYHFVTRPADVSHEHPVLVFDRQNHLHLPLTTFAKLAAVRVALATVLNYLYAILPFFSFLEEDEWQVRKGARWDSAPEVVRDAVTDYLAQRLRCQVREHRLGFQLVALTAGTRNTVGVFLSGLKLFYRIMWRKGHYPSGNPLVDSVTAALKTVEESLLEDEAAYPRMPQFSGVGAEMQEEPRRKRRLSDSYFKLEGEDWVPQIIDEPTLPARVLEGGRITGWRLREVCVTRLLFESGARVSEVTGLTLGDWAARGLLHQATAFSKGSRGRRVKFISFANDTAKLIRRYCETERREIDPDRRTPGEYLRMAERGRADLFQVPLFLTARGTPLTPKTYRDLYWNPACAAAKIDADVHQARHWYVTQAVRVIYETSRGEGELRRRLRELIEYMKWRGGWETMAAYEHYFDSLRHMEVQDSLHRKMGETLENYPHEARPAQLLWQTRQGGSLSQPSVLHAGVNDASLPLAPEDDEFNFLIKIGGTDGY